MRIGSERVEKGVEERVDVPVGGCRAVSSFLRPCEEPFLLLYLIMAMLLYYKKNVRRCNH